VHKYGREGPGSGAGISMVDPTPEKSGALTVFVNLLVKMSDDVDRASR
jgi:hypothetical protein